MTGFLLLFFSLLLLCVSLPALQGYFLADDFNMLTSLERVGIQTFVFHTPGVLVERYPFFRPIAYLVFGTEHHLFGWNAFPYLLFGLLLHLVNSMLAHALFRQSLSGDSLLLATGIFAFHPRLLEARAWPAAVSDLLATHFILVALLLFSPDRRIARRFLGHIYIVLAVFSKESALCLPLLIGFWPGGRLRTSRVVDGLLALVTVFAYLLTRKWFLGEWVGAYGVETHLSLDPFAILKPILSCSLALLFPCHAGSSAYSILEIVRSWYEISSTLMTILLTSGIGLIAGFLVAMRKYFASFWIDDLKRYLIGFLISLIPLYNLSVSLEGSGDRRLYLPAFFFAGCVAILSSSLGRHQRVATSLIVGGLAVLTFFHALDYRNAGQITRTTQLNLQTILKKRQSARIYLVGVPDRLRGIGLFSTGLSELAKSLTAPTPTEVITASRTYLYELPESGSSWTLVERSRGWAVAGVAGSSGALLEGGIGWPGWKPGLPHYQKRQATLELELFADGEWWNIEAITPLERPKSPY